MLFRSVEQPESFGRRGDHRAEDPRDGDRRQQHRRQGEPGQQFTCRGTGNAALPGRNSGFAPEAPEGAACTVLPFFPVSASNMQLPPFPESPPQPASPDDASSGPETPLIIARGSREELGNLVLLLAALGIAYTWRMHSGQLLVAARDAERVLEEWRRYADENAAWPESPAPMLEQTALPPTLLCMAALAIFFACTGPWTEGNPWFATGAVDSQALCLTDETLCLV